MLRSKSATSSSGTRAIGLGGGIDEVMVNAFAKYWAEINDNSEIGTKKEVEQDVCSYILRVIY
jgi:hypothetical protein